MHGLAVSDVDIGREHASTSCSLSSSFLFTLMGHAYLTALNL